jgi:PfaD family protein
MARAGLLAAFGAGGLPLPDVERAAAQLSAATAGASYVMNLLHAPHDPALEQKTVEIYLQHGVRAVEASAFMDLTAALVRYRVSGLRRRGQAIAISHKVIAKVSRLEVGTKFLSPPPSDVVSALVNAGELSAEQADLSRHVPMADDITVEADSGGHTDGRPLPALLPQVLEERYRLSRGFRRRQGPVMRRHPNRFRDGTGRRHVRGRRAGSGAQAGHLVRAESQTAARIVPSVQRTRRTDRS